MRSTAISEPDADQKNATTLPPMSVRVSADAGSSSRSGPTGSGTPAFGWSGARNASS